MKKSLLFALAGTMLLSTGLSSCAKSPNDKYLSKTKPTYQIENHTDNYIDDVYRNYYQVLVYSYFDSNGDGIGDLNGLTQKLDYINDGNRNSTTSLGYDGIYTLPIFPSPTYHKYDATDYYNIDPDYGTLEDFDNFIDACEQRGIDVILDLAINHTSNQHPWFKKACQDIRNVHEYDPITGQPTEEAKTLYPSLRYYHFTYNGTVKLDGTSWHGVSGTNWSYEGSFNSGMPDLNLDEQVVRDELKNVMKFWLDRGVRGFRLDAVQHFYDWNKSKNYEFLNTLSSWGDELTQNRDKKCFLVAEGPWSKIVSTYYENTNGVSYMNFNYGSNGQAELISAVNKAAQYINKIKLIEERGDEVIYSTPEDFNGKSFYILNDGKGFATACAADYFRNSVEKWDERLYKANPNAIDSNFGVNHDTIRLINQMNGSFDVKTDALQNACKFFWGLNNTLTGVSYNYYGEEIGMRAGTPSVEQNKDPDKRHPMYWSTTNTTGMTRYAPGGSPVEQYLEPADKQMEDEDSLWNFMREVLRAKATFPEIARGKQSFVKVGKFYTVMKKTYNGKSIHLIYCFGEEPQCIPLSELGLEEEPKEIKYSLSSSSSYYAKLTAETINVPAYSITII